jgi:hypothetical protein
MTRRREPAPVDDIITGPVMPAPRPAATASPPVPRPLPSSPEAWDVIVHHGFGAH